MVGFDRSKITDSTARFAEGLHPDRRSLLSLGARRSIWRRHISRSAQVPSSRTFPYRNIAAYRPDFIAGQVALGFQLLPNVIGLIKSGDARPLAVAHEKRMTALPDVPTAAEAGLKDYESAAWLALLAPASTSQPMIDKLYAAMAEAVNDPKVRALFVEQGTEPLVMDPQGLKNFMTSEASKWSTIIKSSKSIQCDREGAPEGRVSVRAQLGREPRPTASMPPVNVP